MGISDRIRLLLRAEYSAFKGGTENERNRAISDLEGEFSSLRGQEEQLSFSIRRLRDEVDMWEDRAGLAVNRHDDELARHALTEQNRVLKKIDELRTELHEVQSCLAEISRGLERSHSSKSRLVNFDFDDKDAKSRTPGDADGWLRTQSRRPHKVATSPRYEDAPVRTFDTRDITHSRPFEEFDRVAGEIIHNEAAIEAEQELSGNSKTYSETSPQSSSSDPDPLLDPEGARVEEAFRNLEKEAEQRRLDDDLADLKSKFDS